MNYELAENNFKKAYSINKDAANLNNNLGKIFHRKKDYYFAIKYYFDGLKINPDNYQIYANISLAKFELSNYKDSFKDIKKSEALFLQKNEREFFSIFNSDELNKVMKIYEINDDLKRFEQIVNYINKENKDNRNLLQGILQFKKGDFYSAISTFLEVYKYDNQNKECILYLGKAKLALKDYKNALIALKKYKSLDCTHDVDEMIKTCEDNLKK